MKILILGSEGFVGRNLVTGLSKNHIVLCADLVPASEQTKSSDLINYTQFNITDSSSVDKIVKDVDVVIDLVAHSLISSLDDSLQSAKVNIIGLLNVLESCRKNKIKKIIFTSASSLIGVPSSEAVSEDHRAVPKTSYAITKLVSEYYLRLYNEMFGLNFVIFRFFNIYGPHQKNGLIPTLYNRIVKNESVTVFGKGDQIRDYVFIEDVIPFFEHAILSESVDNNIFNMGTGRGTNITKIIEIISETLQTSPTIDYKPERLGEIGNFVAETTKLESNFGSIPKTNIISGLRQTISWLKSN